MTNLELGLLVLALGAYVVIGCLIYSLWHLTKAVEIIANRVYDEEEAHNDTGR